MANDRRKASRRRTADRRMAEDEDLTISLDFLARYRKYRNYRDNMLILLPLCVLSIAIAAVSGFIWRFADAIVLVRSQVQGVRFNTLIVMAGASVVALFFCGLLGKYWQGQKRCPRLELCTFPDYCRKPRQVLVWTSYYRGQRRIEAIAKGIRAYSTDGKFEFDGRIFIKTKTTIGRHGQFVFPKFWVYIGFVELVDLKMLQVVFTDMASFKQKVKKKLLQELSLLLMELRFDEHLNGEEPVKGTEIKSVCCKLQIEVDGILINVFRVTNPKVDSEL